MSTHTSTPPQSHAEHPSWAKADQAYLDCILKADWAAPRQGSECLPRARDQPWCYLVGAGRGKMQREVERPGGAETHPLLYRERFNLSVPFPTPCLQH